MPPSIPNTSHRSTPVRSTSLPVTSSGSSKMVQFDGTATSSSIPAVSPTTTATQQQQPENDGKPAAATTNTVSQSPATTAATLNNPTTSSALSYGAGAMPGLYGAGAGGMMGLYGAGGMYGGGFGYGMPPMYGPLSGVNQFLMGFQNVVFSLGQAIQIVGMNTHAVNQLLEAATAMFDHAVATWKEMRALENASHTALGGDDDESEEVVKRRRRLRALRWALVTAISYAGYKVIRYLSRRRQPRGLLTQGPAPSYSTRRPYYDYGGEPNYYSSRRYDGSYSAGYGSGGYPYQSGGY